MRFTVGDKIVYPAHGVAVIKKVESKEVSGSKIDFYMLQIVSSGATLMVPVSASEKGGMRALIDEEGIAEVYTILERPAEKISQRAWNRRFREFNDKLRTGSVRFVAEVLRDLWTLQDAKELSYGEKKMQERSKSLLVAEISAAMSVTEESIVQEIDRRLVIAKERSVVDAPVKELTD